MLDISVEQLQFLNPSYKRDFIPFIKDKKHYVRLPLDKVAIFTSNEPKIYAYAEYEFNKREKPFFNPDYVAGNESESITKTKYHKVRRGETLGGISKRYGVTISEIKKWNKLKSNRAPLGKNLRIITEEQVVAVATTAKTKSNVAEKAQDSVLQKGQIKQKELHIVEKGESLFSIAKKYNITKDEIITWNKLEDENILIGSSLQVTAPIELVTENYIVQAGDNLIQIAKKYNVSVDELKEWNELEDSNVKIGTSLKVLLSEKQEVAQVEAKPVKSERQSKYQSEKVYIVKKGDSLFSISQKIKGVTVSDLKKWNGISSGKIKPGMKLKISG